MLSRKRTEKKPGYAQTQVLRDIAEYKGEDPHAIFVGAPPAFRGSMHPGRDLEIQVARKFPRSGIFVEKPLSSGVPEDIIPVGEYFAEHGNFVVVGYMSRYLKSGRFLHRG